MNNEELENNEFVEEENNFEEELEETNNNQEETEEILDNEPKEKKEKTFPLHYCNRHFSYSCIYWSGCDFHYEFLL